MPYIFVYTVFLRFYTVFSYLSSHFIHKNGMKYLVKNTCGFYYLELI